jgi:transposase
MKWRDAILSEAEVLKIRKLVDIGISQVDIARRFGKSLNTINKVVKSQGRYATIQTQEIETMGPAA